MILRVKLLILIRQVVKLELLSIWILNHLVDQTHPIIYDLIFFILLYRLEVEFLRAAIDLEDEVITSGRDRGVFCLEIEAVFQAISIFYVEFEVF